jgi:hypothetical protein
VFGVGGVVMAEHRRADLVYETPSVTELGSVADFTRGSGSGPEWDGIFDFFSKNPGTPSTPTS